MNPLFAKIDSLIDTWCENRNLDCLRLILSAYPLSNGLTDDWEMLLSALKDIRNRYDEKLSQSETISITDCIGEITAVLRNR